MNLKTLMALWLLVFLWSCNEKRTAPQKSLKSSQHTTPSEKKSIQNGDIIFQISLSGQGKAIQLATNSVYTHCGIVFEESKGVFSVLEAIQPVTITPLQDWIARGDNAHYVLKRLKNASEVLTLPTLQRMLKVGKAMVGKPYDIYFGWSDERIYCSELVWKVYKQGANIEIGGLQKLEDFDLTSQEVKQKMQERYGQNIPYKELVISPARLFESELLETVQEN